MSQTALELLEAAQLARREHRPADAHRDLVEAVRLCRQSGERRDLIRALKALGQFERDMGRGDAARSLYEEAVTISREDGDPLMLAHTIRHLGDIHRDSKRLADAELCYLEALALYRAHEPDPLDLANAIRQFAILKEATGKAEEARPLWQETRELYMAVNVQVGAAECSAHLSRLNQ
jgi:tetratricopeptide (TPR) repeat protein